jgi:hypothetical protein
MVPITFRTLDGHQEILELDSATTIVDLRGIIRRRFKLGPGVIRLLYEGTELLDGSQVGGISYRTGTFIVVRFKPEGGAPGRPPPQSQPLNAPPQSDQSRAPPPGPAAPLLSPHDQLQQFVVARASNLEALLRALARSQPALAAKVRADPAPFLRQIGVRLSREPDGAVSLAANAPPSAPAVAAPPAAAPPAADGAEFSPEDLDQICHLMELGFEFAQAADAWRACSGDADLAARLLLGAD